MASIPDMLYGVYRPMLTEKTKTGHAVVIGAGVMGGGIAALFANLGWRISLLDQIPVDAGADSKARNRIAQEGMDRALKSRPPQFALADYASRIRIGNIEDNLDWLRDADWIVEAVAEDIGVKKAVFARIAEHVGPETIISSNTSGLSLAGMVADCPPDFRRRFLGTHFFNPPRYMKCVELAPTADTDPEIFEGFVRFADRVLGKRVIRAKDTPGFISTRLGMYSLVKAIDIAVWSGLRVEVIDDLTGPVIGRPKSGTFRLADIIGLDITLRIIDNLKAALPQDRHYQELQVPELMRKLVAEGRTGAKAGAGFYRREQTGEILALDLKTLEYRPQYSPAPSIPDILTAEDRIHSMGLDKELAHGILRIMFFETLGYIAEVTPEVADRITDVDDALMGGFGWKLGPFHTLDALGEMDWNPVPHLVADMRKAAASTESKRARGRTPASLARFYVNQRGRHFYFDFYAGEMKRLPRQADVIILKDLRKAGKTVEEAASATCEVASGSLVDLGDGVACLEWHNKMNVLDPEIVAFMNRALARAEKDFSALILGGSGEHFSAGFDLGWFAERIESNDWDSIDRALREIQDTAIRLKYAPIPVVCAVYGYALGGGCELMLHCGAVQASFESYIGLPEANVGLIPAGGGTTEMLIRAMANVPPGTILERSDPYAPVRAVWENMRLARFSSSADEARTLGYLRDSDGITIHPDRLLHDAKEHARALAASYRPPAPATVTAMGEEGLARFRWEIHLLRRADQITEHDARIADRLAYILCGGNLIHVTEVSEEYLLGLEREAFLSLAGTPETLARIKGMLDTGKPLRN